MGVQIMLINLRISQKYSPLIGYIDIISEKALNKSEGSSSKSKKIHICYERGT